MVLGYNAECIKENLKGHSIKFYFNPFYDVTNSIGSAWFAREFLSDYDDTCIMNADVYMEEALFDCVLAGKKSPVMFSDGTRKENADYKFCYHGGVLEKFGKDLTGDDITGEYVGIGRFSREFMPVFVKKMDQMIATQQHSVWWENILYSMVGSEQKVYVEEIDGLFWAEVDYIEDYQRILSFRGFTSDGTSNIRPIAEG